MASNPKYQYADWQELHGAQKEALEDFASRVKDTAAGTLKAYAAPFANTAGTLLDAAAESHGNAAVTFPGYNGSNADIDWRALNGAQSSVLQSTARQIQSAADDWKQSGEADIERAKQELGALGKGTVDVSVQGLKLLGDAGLGAATGIGASPYLAIRSFGDAAQTARQEGASVGQQIAYGAGSAISSAVIEKIVNGIGGIYGKGGLDSYITKAVNDVVEKNGLSEWQRVHLKNSLTALIEGIESGLTNVANHSTKSIYNGKDSLENLFIADWGNIGRDVLNNFIIALLIKEK